MRIIYLFFGFFLIALLGAVACQDPASPNPTDENPDDRKGDDVSLRTDTNPPADWLV